MFSTGFQWFRIPMLMEMYRGECVCVYVIVCVLWGGAMEGVFRFFIRVVEGLKMLKLKCLK